MSLTWPELNLVYVARSNWEYCYSVLDGMLVHCRVTPSSTSPVPIYTTGWKDNMGQSFLSKETTWSQGLSIEPQTFRSEVQRVNNYTTAPRHLACMGTSLWNIFDSYMYLGHSSFCINLWNRSVQGLKRHHGVSNVEQRCEVILQIALLQQINNLITDQLIFDPSGIMQNNYVSVGIAIWISSIGSLE